MADQAASAQSPDASGKVGRWRLRATLGSGGMGVVYLAEADDWPEPVALKTVRSDSPGLLDAMRREIQVLRRLRHPGVVRVVDSGVNDGVPWYAMERLQGPTLREWLAVRATASGAIVEPTVTMPLSGDLSDAPPVQGSDRGGLPRALWPEAARLFRAMCDALAWLHGEGVVHRDLKPDNIFLRADGSPVLVDFGLFRSFSGAEGREALDAEGTSGLGTLAYVSPEQLRGELVDARADLYALGCVLYEAATGRPPFLGGRERVAWQHLHADPLPASALVADLPVGLDDLLRALLAKSPRDRLGYAADVAQRLEALALDAPLGAPDTPRPRPYLYRPALVARDGALAALTEKLPERGTPGAIAAVLGPSGVGKTRLVVELARVAKKRRLQVVRAECPPVRRLDASEGPPRIAPLHAMRPLLVHIADHCRVAGPEETELILGERAPLLARYEPALAPLCGDHAMPEPLLRAASSRERLFRWLADTISAYAARLPTLLLIDDLQWADDLTLGFLEAVASETVQLDGVLVATTVRAESPEGAPEITRHAAVRALWLPPLGATEVRQLVADTMAVTNPPQPLVSRAAAVSGGNPFYVGEYLQVILSRGDLARHDGRWALDETSDLTSLPDTLPDLLAARYEALDGPARAVLDAASVVGTEVDGAILGAVTDLSDDALLAALGALLLRSLLEELEPGRFHLAHGRVGEAAYARLGEDGRRALHRRVAEAFVAGEGPEPAVLAHHYRRAGVPRETWRWLGHAAEHAWQAGAPADARRMLDEAFALQQRPEVVADVTAVRLAELEVLHAKTLHAAGEVEPALSSARSALARTGRRVPRTRLGWFGRLLLETARQLVGPRARTSRANTAELVLAIEALTVMERASLVKADALVQLGAGMIGLNLADRAAPDAPVAHAYTTLGAAFGLMGVDRVYRRLLARGREVAIRSGAELQIVSLADTFVSSVRGRWERAEQVAAEGAAAAQRAGDFYNLTQIELALGVGLLMRGDLPRLRELMPRVRDQAQRGGYGVEEMYALLLLAGAAWSRGDLDACLHHLDLAQPRCEALDDAGGVSTVYATRACALAGAREIDAARAFADRALTRLRGASMANPTFVVPYTRLPWAYLRLHALGAQGPTAATPDPLTAARELLKVLRRLVFFQPPARATHHRLQGWLAAEEGRVAEARAQLGLALAAATDLAQPFEQGLAHWELGRLADEDVERATHHARARTLFAALDAQLPPFGAQA